MRIQTLFKAAGQDHPRIPSVVAAPDGKVYAFINNRVGSDRDDTAETEILCTVRSLSGAWSKPLVVARQPDWSCMIGSAVVDTSDGRVMCLYKKIAVVENEFVKELTPEERERLARQKEERDGVQEGDYVVETLDGEVFRERKIPVAPNRMAAEGFLLGAGGFSHGSGAGITVRHGEHAGRLLIPARISLHPVTDWEGLKTGSANTVLYSDDHGKSFQTGGIVEAGTGEGTLAELPDGRIYFNSRAYFGDGLRRSAWSCDAGETFLGQKAQQDLIEPCCNAAVVSAAYRGREILLFSNPKSTSERINMTLSASFDGGVSWQEGKCIDRRFSGYSSLAYEANSGLVFLLYECVEKTSIDEIDIAEFTVEEALAR
ncbi:MAG: exo-alpha-sialidase [Clostridia bacterium]|nr:exo-alpha-sialidase [Clostridia bacterium]